MVTNAVNKESVLTGRALKLSTALKAAQALPALGPTITFRGVVTTPTQLVQVINNVMVPYQAVTAAHTALSQAVATRKLSDAATTTFLGDLQAAITAAFGATSTVFQQFGFKVRKTPTPLTAAAKVVRSQKAKATRIARGTLGSKQKKAVKGDVTTPVTVDPATNAVTMSDAMPAPSSSPSPAKPVSSTSASSGPAATK